jgi:hypothetical protein
MDFFSANLEMEEAINYMRKTEVEIYEKILKNIAESKDVQHKCRLIMIDKEKIPELAAMLRVIEKNFKDEFRSERKGIAYHLVGIIVHCLATSSDFWEKLFLIVGSQKNHVTLEALDSVINISSIYSKIMETIEDYFKCLNHVDEQYFVDEEKVTEFHNQELLEKLQFNHLLVLLHHLMHHEKIGRIVADRIFSCEDYSPEFRQFLKDSINSLSK